MQYIRLFAEQRFDRSNHNAEHCESNGSILKPGPGGADDVRPSVLQILVAITYRNNNGPGQSLGELQGHRLGARRDWISGL